MGQGMVINLFGLFLGGRRGVFVIGEIQDTAVGMHAAIILLTCVQLGRMGRLPTGFFAGGTSVVGVRQIS